MPKGSRALSDLKVKDLMSAPVITIGRNDRLTQPEVLMHDKRIRHLPVLDEDDMLCGLTTQRDLFRGALLRSLGFGSRAEDSLLEKMLVKDVMSEELTTTSPDTNLSDAAATMIEKKVGCLPVLDGDRLVGILTETDFVKLALA